MSSRVVCACLQIRTFSHVACRDACVEPTACNRICAFALTSRCDPLNPTPPPQYHHRHHHHHAVVGSKGRSPLQLLSPPPVAAMWKDPEQPWETEARQRLEYFLEEQWQERETWPVADQERRKWSQWEDNSTWHFVEGHWTWTEWKDGAQWHWVNGTWWKEEPATRLPPGASSSRRAEDEEEENVTFGQAMGRQGHHRWTTATPMSFQPLRHMTMVLGRPVVVLLCSKIQCPSIRLRKTFWFEE